MATLKEHQAAMVDLLANGSGIPASASRLAHAMHDVLAYLAPKQEDDYFDAKGFAHILKAKREAETTPGLNDRALSKREKALKTDSPAKWPTPAEQRIKELENTIKQLRGRVASLKADNNNLECQLNAVIALREPEQAGCRKLDTQVCDGYFHKPSTQLYPGEYCPLCGATEQ